MLLKKHLHGDIKGSISGCIFYIDYCVVYFKVHYFSIVCVLNPINPASYHTDEDDGISYTGFISRIANEAFSCILFVYQVMIEYFYNMNIN